MTSACGGTIRHPRRSLVRLPSTNDSPRVLPGHGPAPRSLALILSSPPPGQGYSPLFRPDHALSGRLKRPIGQIFLAWRLSDFIPRRIRYLRPLHVARCQPSTLLLALPTFPSHKYSQVCQPPQGSAFKPAPTHSRVRHLTCDKPFALSISQQYSEARSSVAATVAISPSRLSTLSAACLAENQTRTRARARTHDPISNLNLIATSPRCCNGSHSTDLISTRRALPHLNHWCMGKYRPRLECDLPCLVDLGYRELATLGLS